MKVSGSLLGTVLHELVCPHHGLCAGTPRRTQPAIWFCMAIGWEVGFIFLNGQKERIFCDMRNYYLNSDFSGILEHIMPFVYIMSVVASTLQLLMEVVEIAAMMPAK